VFSRIYTTILTIHPPVQSIYNFTDDYNFTNDRYAMDYIMLYASGLILYQTIQTLEQRRAIPHLKQLVADIRLSSRASLASNGIKL
jgi:hypothetical protein